MNDPTKKLARPNMDLLRKSSIDENASSMQEDHRSTINEKPFNTTLTHGLAKQLTEPVEEDASSEATLDENMRSTNDLAFNETLVLPQQTQLQKGSPFFPGAPPNQAQSNPAQPTLNLQNLRDEAENALPLAQTIATDAMDSATQLPSVPQPHVDTLQETLVQTFNDSPAVQTARLNSLSETSSSLKQTTRQTSLPTVVKDEGQPRLKFESRERYKKVGDLGEGGMGDVSLVQDDDIHRRVAMKRLKRADSDSLLRFIDEIHTIGQLEHPNIIPIHDVGVDQDGSYFFIMKHIEGETLEDIITKLRDGKAEYHSKYTFDVRIQIFLNILQAISFAHSQDIIHRDIKPANIMVGKHGEVTVMDWGLAKPLDRTEEERNQDLLDLADTLEQKMLGGTELDIKQRLRLTQQGELLGTPAYMSPEQAQGLIDKVDKRTDTYALSILFYELMTLTHPLEDKTSLITMLHAVINDDPTFAANVITPHQHRIPAEVSHYIKHGTDKSLEARFQDADDMIFHLQRVIDGTFDIDCPVTFLKSTNNRINRSIDKNPWPMVIASVLLVTLFASSLIFSIYSLLT